MTQEETDGFTKRVNGICDEVISTIESRKEEAQSGLKDLFIADDQVIDESEQKYWNCCRNQVMRRSVKYRRYKVKFLRSSKMQ